MSDGRELEFAEVSMVFDGVPAVDGLTARVDPGRVTAFLGPNGAGKTTTLRILLGQLRPTRGRATIGGRVLTGRPDASVGSVLDISALQKARRKSVAKYLTTAAKKLGVSQTRVREVLAVVGLAEMGEVRIASLSLGMKHRLAVAEALLGDPGVLVFDEPANGLDPEGIRWIRLLMRRFADEGRTVLMSSHVLSEVEQVADAVLVLNEGQLLFEGPIELLADAGPGIVTADSDDRPALQRALADAGLTFRVLRNGITIDQTTTTEVGALAARAGVALTTLTHRGPSLEDVYLQIIDGTWSAPARTAALDPQAFAAADAADADVPADEGAPSEGATADDDEPESDDDAQQIADAEAEGFDTAIGADEAAEDSLAELGLDEADDDADASADADGDAQEDDEHSDADAGVVAAAAAALPGAGALAGLASAVRDGEEDPEDEAAREGGDDATALIDAVPAAEDNDESDAEQIADAEGEGLDTAIGAEAPEDDADAIDRADEAEQIADAEGEGLDTAIGAEAPDDEDADSAAGDGLGDDEFDEDAEAGARATEGSADATDRVDDADDHDERADEAEQIAEAEGEGLDTAIGAEAPDEDAESDENAPEGGHDASEHDESAPEADENAEADTAAVDVIPAADHAEEQPDDEQIADAESEGLDTAIGAEAPDEEDAVDDADSAVEGEPLPVEATPGIIEGIPSSIVTPAVASAFQRAEELEGDIADVEREVARDEALAAAEDEDWEAQLRAMFEPADEAPAAEPETEQEPASESAHGEDPIVTPAAIAGSSFGEAATRTIDLSALTSADEDDHDDDVLKDDLIGRDDT